MRLRSYIFAIVLLGCLACEPVIRASAFTLGNDTNQIFDSENVGPYLCALSGSSFTNFFCLDYTLTSTFGTTYPGTVAVPTTPQEEEVAFLAAYAMYQGSPSSAPGEVNLVEGPISFAIWQIMGTLGTTPPNPAGLQYVQTAEFAYSHNLIPQSFLNSVLIFSPKNDQNQRFITAVPNSAMVSRALSAVPEPGSTELVAGALIGFALLMKRVSCRSHIFLR